MALAALAFACFVYRGLDTKKTYEKLREKTNYYCDLSNPSHRQALIKWLRTWGIRRITEEQSKVLESWYKQNKNKLPDRDKNLWSLCDSDLASIDQAYNDLVGKKWIGHTTAAKILFAIKPQALIPWDKRIRDSFLRADVNGSYAGFVKSMRDKVKELCKKHGFEPEHLLKELQGRNLIELNPSDTVPKLIDEYDWITITKRCKPTKEILQRWADWSV